MNGSLKWRNLQDTVKTLRTDNGEFTSTKFCKYLKKVDIKHELTIPKYPGQNGVAEWPNKMLIEIVCAMLDDSGLPKSFWAEALSIAVCLRNRWPTRAIKGRLPMRNCLVQNLKLDISGYLDVLLTKR